MSPATHFLTGWVLACVTLNNRKDRTIVTLAAVAPDLDGLGAIPDLLTRHSAHPTDLFGQYHHSLHNLGFVLLVAAFAWGLSQQRWRTAALALIALHLHLLEDLVGSRGPDAYQWPIPYLAPFSRALQLSWEGQWALNGWQNILITTALLMITLYVAWDCGYSPVEVFSARSDAKFIETVQRRFPKRPRISA